MIFSKKYGFFTLIVVALFFAWGTWGLILNKTSPFASPEIAVPLFYGTSALVILLSFFVFSLLFRFAFFGEKTIAHHANAALRQGIIFAALGVGLLLFQQFQILTLPIGAMIVAMAISIEAFFWNR